MITEFNKGTMVVLPIPVEGNYLFTIEEALAYIASSDKFYLLDDMMVYNMYGAQNERYRVG